MYSQDIFYRIIEYYCIAIGMLMAIGLVIGYTAYWIICKLFYSTNYQYVEYHQPPRRRGDRVHVNYNLMSNSY